MQIPFHQTNQLGRFNNRFVMNCYRTNTDTSAHSRHRMLEAQDEVKETEVARVNISAEAMALSQQAKAMARAKQLMENREIQETQEDSDKNVELTDEEIYEEMLNQVGIWGDKAYALLHDFNHKETAEMAEKRAAAANEMKNLEEMQKSEISKIQRDAQKAAETASMKQEELNKKSAELIMMIESFKEQDDEETDAAEGEKNKDDDAKSTGSLMDGEFGALAAKGEMGMLDTMNTMDKSSTYRIAASDHSIKGVENERRNIYRANDAPNFTLKEKIEEMSYFVCTLANNEDMKASFMERIENETDSQAKKKLGAMMEYFEGLEMKNVYQDLKRDREYALQERITARDLRIAHLGNRHLALAEQQKKELQSLFDEDDILRQQEQDGIADRTQDVSERLQEKLDERDHIDEEETKSEKEMHEREELTKEELQKEESENENL